MYFGPALTGLSAPYWDPYARGLITGIIAGTQRGHLARATLEGIVVSVRDFIDTMSRVSGNAISQIDVDGGSSPNDLLMQIQADQLGVSVIRPKNTEATSLGVAPLAGLAVGVWSTPEDALTTQQANAQFTPSLSDAERSSSYASWTPIQIDPDDVLAKLLGAVQGLGIMTSFQAHPWASQTRCHPSVHQSRILAVVATRVDRQFPVDRGQCRA